MSKIILFVLFHTFTFWAVSSTPNFVSPELDEKTVRFFCQPTHRTPYCPMVCKIFPQFCQPDTTTQEPPTSTGMPATTGPPCFISHYNADCTFGAPFYECANCLMCPVEQCCSTGYFIAGVGCTAGDLSCYVCPPAVTTTQGSIETTSLSPTTEPTTTPQPTPTTTGPTTPPPTTACGSMSLPCSGVPNLWIVNPWDCTKCHFCLDGVSASETPCSSLVSVPDPLNCLCEDDIHRTTSVTRGLVKSCVNHCSSPLPTTTQTPTTTDLATTGIPTTTLAPTTQVATTTTAAPTPVPTTTEHAGLCESSSFSCADKGSNRWYENEWDCTMCHFCSDGAITNTAVCSTLIGPTIIAPTGKTTSPSVKCVNYCTSSTTQTPTTAGPETTTGPEVTTTMTLPFTTLPTTTGVPVTVETCTKTCQNRADGLYASPENCLDFYRCSNGLISMSGTCGGAGVLDYPTLNCMQQESAACYECTPGVPLTLPTPQRKIPGPSMPPTIQNDVVKRVFV